MLAFCFSGNEGKQENSDLRLVQGCVAVKLTHNTIANLKCQTSRLHGTAVVINVFLYLLCQTAFTIIKCWFNWHLGAAQELTLAHIWLAAAAPCQMTALCSLAKLEAGLTVFARWPRVVVVLVCLNLLLCFCWIRVRRPIDWPYSNEQGPVFFSGRAKVCLNAALL